MSMLNLRNLSGPAVGTAESITCDICGQTFEHDHENTCSFHPDLGDENGDCLCEGREIIYVAGYAILRDCPNGCDQKIIEIIEALLPTIASKYPPLLKKQAQHQLKLADDLEKIGKLG